MKLYESRSKRLRDYVFYRSEQVDTGEKLTQIGVEQHKALIRQGEEVLFVTDDNGSFGVQLSEGYILQHFTSISKVQHDYELLATTMKRRFARLAALLEKRLVLFFSWKTEDIGC